MHISIDPERLFARRLAAIALLAGLYVIIEGLSIVTDHPSMLGLVQFVDLNGEFNLPSSFSTLAMLFSAVILWLAGGIHKKAAIHESVRDLIIRRGLPGSVGWVGRSFSVWIVPYVIFCGAIGLVVRKAASGAATSHPGVDRGCWGVVRGERCGA